MTEPSGLLIIDTGVGMMNKSWQVVIGLVALAIVLNLVYFGELTGLVVHNGETYKLNGSITLAVEREIPGAAHIIINVNDKDYSRNLSEREIGNISEIVVELEPFNIELPAGEYLLSAVVIDNETVLALRTDTIILTDLTNESVTTTTLAATLPINETTTTITIPINETTTTTLLNETNQTTVTTIPVNETTTTLTTTTTIPINQTTTTTLPSANQTLNQTANITTPEETTKQLYAEINKPVKLVKTIRKNTSNFEIELPPYAFNVSITDKDKKRVPLRGVPKGY